MHFFRLWGRALFVCLFTKLLNCTECIFFPTSLFKRGPGLFCLLAKFWRKNGSHPYLFSCRQKRQNTYISRTYLWNIFANWMQPWWFTLNCRFPAALEAAFSVARLQSMLAWDVRYSLKLKWRTWSLPELTTLTPPRMIIEACADQLLHADVLYYYSFPSTHPEGLALSPL